MIFGAFMLSILLGPGIVTEALSFILSLAAVFHFRVVANLAGVPVVVVRLAPLMCYGLSEARFLSDRAANFLGVVIPRANEGLVSHDWVLKS